MSLEVKLKTTALTWDLTLCSRMKFGTKSVQTPMAQYYATFNFYPLQCILVIKIVLLY